MTEEIKITCPECGSKEDQLDYWIDKESWWHWYCYECGHEWKIHQKGMGKILKKGGDK